MDNTSSIFPETDHLLLQKYRKRIVTARVFLFIAAGFGFLANLSIFVAANRQQIEMLNIVSWIGFGFSCLILFLAIFSLKKPHISMLIATIIMALCLAVLLISFMNQFNTEGLIPLLIQVVFLYFIARGMVYAKKRNEIVDLTPSD